MGVIGNVVTLCHMVLLIIVSVLPGVRFIKSTEYRLSVENFTSPSLASRRVLFEFQDNIVVLYYSICSPDTCHELP